MAYKRRNVPDDGAIGPRASLHVTMGWDARMVVVAFRIPVCLVSTATQYATLFSQWLKLYTMHTRKPG